MNMIEIWRTRMAHRGQGGFSMLGGLLALAGTATLAGLVAAGGNEQVGAAETTACQYDKSVINTAVEATHLMSADLKYPVAAGADGLDAVRAAGYMKNVSKYWRYAGPDAAGKPQYVQLSAVNGCD
ncbi:MAG: hypothetical protein U0Q22_04940 [Acidimicrobiales bacterium]